MWRWLERAAVATDRAGGGLALDIGLYALSALFAGATAAGSTLAPHRAWGAVAAVGYGAAALVASAQLVARPRRMQGHPARQIATVGCPSLQLARAGVAVAAWVATALVPLVIQAWQRAGGRIDRAQEEVLVIEDAGRRLVDAGTPYLDRAAIAAMPEPDRILAYVPYQPGMATFGVPRALDGSAAWWSDARVWFALVTAVALATALLTLRRAGAPAPALVRGLQVATVLPVCALTLATGGDDLPVLALCLLALALAARGRIGVAGLAVGAAAALKLFAWPVALVLGAHAATRGRSAFVRYAVSAVAPTLITLLPAALVDCGAVVENVVAFPLGRGLVTSPAQSPLPGHLIATTLPAGRAIATGLLLLAGAVIAVGLVRNPPRTSAAASLICGYGLLAAVVLVPATRFGYLLYPAAFLVWAASLRLPVPDDLEGDRYVVPLWHARGNGPGRTSGG